MKTAKYLIVLLLTALVCLLSACSTTKAKTLPEPNEAVFAVMQGSTGEAYVEAHYPDAELQRFVGISDAIAALSARKADYAISSYTNCVNFANHSDGTLTVLDGKLTHDSAAVAITKDNVELTEKITAIVDKYLADGTMDTIVSNWIRDDGSDYVREEIPIAEDGEILDIAVSAEREPMCFVENGKITGLDVELIKRVAYELGMKPVLHNMSFSALVTSVNSGKTEVAVSNISVTEERSKSVNFSTPYFLNPQVLITRTELLGESAGSGEGFFESLSDSFYRNFVVENRWLLIVRGIGITLLISVCAGVFGTVLGFGICFLRMSRKKVPQRSAAVLIRIVQGTPIVVLLMIFYYIVFNKTGLDGVGVAIIAFGLNFAAYVSEMFRSGINAVDVGQSEAAAAIGFPKRRAFRKIIFPQAARHFLPVMKGEFISLVKMTSVVGYVAVEDLTKAGDIIRSRTYEAFFPLIVTAVIYFLLSFGLSSLLTLIEVRIDPKQRPRTLKGVKL